MTKRSDEPSASGAPVPRRATSVFLGIWMAVLLFLAFFVVPQLFAGCIPQTQ